MKIEQGFAHCQWLVLINETAKLNSISDRNIRLLIQYGWRTYHKIKSDGRRTNPKKKQNELDWITETLEALNSQQFRRSESEKHKRIAHALKAGTLFRRAENDTKIVNFPNSPEFPRV